MAVDIVLPNLGFDVQEARLLEWLKQPGERVSKGEALAVIESDKANVELESIAEGVLLQQLYPADTMIPTGAVIARIGSTDEPLPASPAPSESQQSEETRGTRVTPVARRMAEQNRLDLAQVAGSGQRGTITRSDIEQMLKQTDSAANGILALPKVRKAAREAGIDLTGVAATGTRGQITAADLANFIASQASPAPSATSAPQRDTAADTGRTIPLSRTRQIIGERLARSMQEAPHFYVTGEFDLEQALQRLPDGIKVNDLLQYLTVQTLLRVPELNATYHQGQLIQHEQVNLAIAVALPDGLITPVLPGAERYSLRGLASEGRELIRRARDNRLNTADLTAGTFTISNLGVIQQVDHFTAVINPPQVGILAAGSVKARIVIRDGGVHIRRTVFLTISGDHRVVDGMHLARFLQAFQQELDIFAGAAS